MRTYLILKERGARWNADPEIQALLEIVAQAGQEAPVLSTYSSKHRDALLGGKFDRIALAAKGLEYERLDQLTVDVLLGVR
jgi:xylose isomerase